MASLATSLLHGCKYANAVVAAGFAVYFFLLPGAILVFDLADPAIRRGGMPRAAVRIHRQFSPAYARWARSRVLCARATRLGTDDISGTEWPLFGSVFYLWATEALQEAWEQDRTLAAVAPRVYARDAIEAATALVIDPGHATWVRKHWGEAYLERENVFYRMLLIAALCSHHRLTGDERYLALLRRQVQSLASEIDRSPHGLLEDYPGQCYPGDVLMAIRCIRRADGILGTDHRGFAQRAIRAFRGSGLDKRGLVPYAARSASGRPCAPSRGCSNSYVLLAAPHVWPLPAREWFRRYVRHFWQRNWLAQGFREFPRDLPGRQWYLDVDAGPVLAGFGTAACAFGAGACRVNGRFEFAYPLTAQMLVASWPLPNGFLLTPWLLSNAGDAPYLGEAAVLYCLTRQPAAGVRVSTGGDLPWLVYIALAMYFACGLALLAVTARDIRSWRRRTGGDIPLAAMQLGTWFALLTGVAATLMSGYHVLAALLLLAMQLVLRPGTSGNRARTKRAAK